MHLDRILRHMILRNNLLQCCVLHLIYYQFFHKVDYYMAVSHITRIQFVNKNDLLQFEYLLHSQSLYNRNWLKKYYFWFKLFFFANYISEDEEYDSSERISLPNENNDTESIYESSYAPSLTVLYIVSI